jgi:lysozyme
MGFWSFIGGLFRDASGAATSGQMPPLPPAPIEPSPSYVATVIAPVPLDPPILPAGQTQLPSPPSYAPPIVPDWLGLCLPMTKHFEACYLTAYCDPASPRARALQAAGLWYKYLEDRSVAQAPQFINLDGRPWTAGYGSTANVGIATVFTQDQAEARLRSMLIEEGLAVDRLVTIPLLPQQKAALTDWSYNEGEGRLAESTMLKRLNDHNIGEALSEMLTWDKAGGKVEEGLLLRREANKRMFTTGKWQA